MRQPNRYSASAAASTPVDALVQAQRTVSRMLDRRGPLVGYTATVEASSTTPAMIGAEPVDVVVEYVATVTVDHLPEKP